MSLDLLSNVAASLMAALIVIGLLAAFRKLIFPWVRDQFQAPEPDVQDGAERIDRCVSRHVSEKQARKIVQSVEKRLKAIEDDLFGTELRIMKEGKEIPIDDVREELYLEQDILEKFAAAIRKDVWDSPPREG